MRTFLWEFIRWCEQDRVMTEELRRMYEKAKLLLKVEDDFQREVDDILKDYP